MISCPASGIEKCSVVSLVASGLLVGVSAGLLGIGGGVLLIPLLVYGFGLLIRQAIGTSSLMIFVSAFAGTILYAIAGHVSLIIAGSILAGSSVGVQLGARHSLKFRPDRLQRAFATLVMIVAVLAAVKVLD
ncbi:MAG: sulfite exporter TauE/SafE family protein [Armatimonadota bacterium]